MNVGAPELLIVLLVFGALFLVPTVLGIVRAAQNNDTGWILGIIGAWFIGFGWLVGLIYLLSVHPNKGRPVAPGLAPPPPSTPGGWHADPTSRFEQRYFDGTRWTEHVTRAGQQFTDPI